MRRAAIAVAAAAALLGAAPAAHARTDDGAKPIVFISGAESGTVDCGKFWSKLTGRMRHVGLKVGGVDTRITGAYEYLTSGGAGDGCAESLPSDRGIEEQARRFTDWLIMHHAGDDVDVVAQGTAGVMVRVAMAKAKLAIEDVVTLGAPHTGSAKLAKKCSATVCDELDPDSTAGAAFLKKLAGAAYADPQGKNGTDWTAIASASDELVATDSALGMDADHKTTYSKPELEHAELITDGKPNKDATITYSHRDVDPVEWRKAPHVADRVAADLILGAQPATDQAGCTGSNDQTGGGTRVDDPGLYGFGAPAGQALSYVRSGPMEAYSTCFTKTDNNMFVSNTKVRLNGLDIVPSGGAVVVIDPKARRILSDRMTMSIPSQWFDQIPIPLLENAKLDWALPKEAGGALTAEDLDGIGTSGGKILGLPIKGGHKLTVVQGGVSLEVSAGVTGFFGGTGFTEPGRENKSQCSNGKDDDYDGDVDYPADKDCKHASDDYESDADGLTLTGSIRTDNTKGLIIDKFGGSIEGNLRLGPLKIYQAALAYSRAENEWAASFTTELPFPNNPTLKAEASLKDGKLKSISGEVDNLNKGPLGSSPLFLQRVKLGYTYQPNWELALGTTLSLWPRFHYNDKWTSVTEWAGDLTISASSTKLAGKLLVLGDEWGNGSLEIKYGDAVSGIVQVGLNKKIAFKDKAEENVLKILINANVTGTVDGNGVEIAGDMGMCFEGELSLGVFTGTLDPTCVAKAKARLVGRKNLFAGSACATLDLGIDINVGAVFKQAPKNGNLEWSGDTFAGACDVDDWIPAAGAAQAGGPDAVTIGAGQRAAVIGVKGDGAPPHVALSGPGGERIPAPKTATGIARGDGYAFVHFPGAETTYVIVAKPRAGRWTVEPQADSAPVRRIRSANALPEPEVHARVTGRGRTRLLSYDVKTIPGQVVRLREIGGGVERALGTARGAHGRLRFAPAFGKGGPRKIVAEIEQGGFPRTELVVARYVAPEPGMPRAPKRVSVKRRGDRLTAVWSRVAGAHGYTVTVFTGDGREVGFDVAPDKARRVVVRHMLGSRRSRVVVRAARPDGRLGPAKVVRGG